MEIWNFDLEICHSKKFDGSYVYNSCEKVWVSCTRSVRAGTRIRASESTSYGKQEYAF
jgi:hypothetical protein